MAGTGVGALSIRQAAADLDVDARTVRRLIEAGDLTAFRVGRVWRISAAELDSFVRAQTARAGDGRQAR